MKRNSNSSCLNVQHHPHWFYVVFKFYLYVTACSAFFIAFFLQWLPSSSAPWCVLSCVLVLSVNLNLKQQKYVRTSKEKTRMKMKKKEKVKLRRWKTTTDDLDLDCVYEKREGENKEHSQPVFAERRKNSLFCFLILVFLSSNNHHIHRRKWTAAHWSGMVVVHCECESPMT